MLGGGGGCFLTGKEETSRLRGTKRRAVPKMLQKMQMRLEEEEMKVAALQ